MFWFLADPYTPLPQTSSHNLTQNSQVIIEAVCDKDISIFAPSEYQGAKHPLILALIEGRHCMHCNPKKETESKGKGPETETEDREGGSQENIQNCKIVHKEKKGRRPRGEN